ncbi:metallophosphoesterase family protein [Deminuibacter soli]|uniref:Metallophosphoesterase n=1 Tax=Deminuibacter soli TaxID=2291815 RepID=A0A3E1NF06_9BACT|nr:metallophosphoesterase [Deminuibacter soli]RFM26563.1 metallophosphoesterase [Deminuibacter soli]
MKRRTLLKTLGALSVAPAVLPAAAAAATAPRSAKPVLRLAHITDVHLKGELNAPEKFVRCLEHIHQQSPKVDLVLNGGDTVFDMNKEQLPTIEAEWKLWHSIIEAHCHIPMKHCLGNHDIWWYEEGTKGDPAYGKQYSLKQLKMEAPWYTFNQAGWQFIVLDSVHLDIDNTWYIGKLGDAQYTWLEQQLAQLPATTPVCILSHIPLLTATLMIEDNIVNRWEFTGGDMHTDIAKLTKLFVQHPNVKLCLSGHIHIRDKVVYNNVTYICDGAVSGAWWNGNRRETPPGYGLIDLYADGTFDEQYVPYLER